MDPEVSQVTESGKCLVCGKVFETVLFLMDGRKILGNYRCSECNEKLLAQRAEQEARDREFEKARRWSAICPWEYRTIEEGGNTDVLRMTAERPNWSKVTAWKMGRRGLLIHGNTGRCKTRAMWRLLRKLFDERVRFISLTAYQFEAQARDAMSSFSNEALFETLAEVPVLFFDDLGKMAVTECIQSALYGLVDERVAQGRPILATTNDTGETLAERLALDRGQPFIRRLRDYCDSMNL